MVSGPSGLTIPAGVTLSIPAGTVVKLIGGGLSVAGGTLSATGSAAAPVVADLHARRKRGWARPTRASRPSPATGRASRSPTGLREPQDTWLLSYTRVSWPAIAFSTRGRAAELGLAEPRVHGSRRRRCRSAQHRVRRDRDELVHERWPAHASRGRRHRELGRHDRRRLRRRREQLVRRDARPGGARGHERRRRRSCGTTRSRTADSWQERAARPPGACRPSG